MTQTLAPATGFRHEALFYAGEDEFVRKAGAFVQDGLAAGDAVLVVVGSRKIGRLREHLGPGAEGVLFADMAEVGRNPARIIPAWREFVAAHAAAGAGMRGIGEPIDPSRDAETLAECERHEALLNVAFADSPSWSLLCPYDTDALPPPVIEEALRNHPYVRNGVSRPNSQYRGLAACAPPLHRPLPDPPSQAIAFHADLGTLGALRKLATRVASEQGFERRQVEDFVLTVHELATNSVRHGGGSGIVRLWAENGAVVADVRDRGRIVDPLAGRLEPPLDVPSGRGLWLANQLSDLVQIRVYDEGGAVRARLRKH